MTRSRTEAWVEAMRLRTLPVSVSGVLAGAGCAAYYGRFRWLPFLICLIFAIMAQIVSNFANEYFDFRNGLDRKGREGFRRGVTEGDISPAAMRNATFGLLIIACAMGCSLILWGGWWLILVGIAIAVFALAYSTGPWPLSHHGLGEVAVIIFFGIVPVTLTTYVQTQSWEMLPTTLPISVAIGLMGANVMIVNNYRDLNDDRKVGKRTLAVIIGPKATLALYIINSFAALILIETAVIARIPYIWQFGFLAYINMAFITWRQMQNAKGHQLNPLLGKTAGAMLFCSVWILLTLSANCQ